MALLHLTITAQGGEDALRGVSALVTTERTAAHQAIAAGVERLTRDYLAAVPSRKGTAANLGASPVGFYKEAAGTVEAKGTPTGIMLRMQRAGLSRAFYPYDLRPRSGKLLTIPVSAEAYGKRARSVPGLKWARFTKEDVAEGRSTHEGLVLGRPAPEPGGLFSALFRGVTKVHQDQDRSILPGDQAWLDEVAEGALEFMEEQSK